MAVLSLLRLQALGDSELKHRPHTPMLLSVRRANVAEVNVKHKHCMRTAEVKTTHTRPTFSSQIQK